MPSSAGGHVSVADFGSWSSPIVSKLLTEESISFSDVQLDLTEAGRGIVYWAETRPSEKGRGVVCSCVAGQNFVAWTPSEFSVRTKVNEYGGGSFFVHDGTVFFSNIDQRLYKQDDPNLAPSAITPDNKNFKYANGVCFKNAVYCVREDHSAVQDGKEEITTLIRIDLATQSQHVLAEGMDFYASPQISPQGDKLAWMQWKHPNMPWDSCEIILAKLSSSGLIEPNSVKKIAASKGVSNVLPTFSPTGSLFFVSDRSNWYNLYSVDASEEQKNVCVKERDICPPHWIMGRGCYAFDPSSSGDIAVTFDGELGILNLKSGIYYKLDTGYTDHEYIWYDRNKCIYSIASSPTKFTALIQHNVQTGKTEVIRASKVCMIDEGFLSVPEHITYPCPNLVDVKAHAYFYAPKNKNFKGPADKLPPLVVFVHGGPTASASNSLNLQRQFYTSRGFAVLDVNFRGSSGFGRKYRDLLKGNYGVFDMEDCCQGALHLAKENKVDSSKLAIRGGSSGGYTVLCCLTFKHIFHVGVSHYGISDVEACAKDSEKFEKYYFDQLIGPYPAQKGVYVERSPIHYVDHLKAPVAFFQGLDDKVVHPSQSQKMYDALVKKGIATSLVMFEGEGHGFRKSDSIELALDGEYCFICNVLGISPSVHVPPEKMKIVNLHH